VLFHFIENKSLVLNKGLPYLKARYGMLERKQKPGLLYKEIRYYTLMLDSLNI